MARMPAVFVAAVFLPMLAMAQEPESWRSIANLELLGCKSFPAPEITDALLLDATVQTGVRAAPDVAAAGTILATGVREGYRHAGFTNATVEAEVVDGRIRLHVSEGERHRCGTVTITGNSVVTTEAIVAELSKRAGRWPGWRPEEFAPSDELARGNARKMLLYCYARKGRHDALGEVLFEPDGNRLNLRFTVTGEGHDMRVGRLELVGEREADVAEVLARVRVPVDAVYTAELAESLRSQLEDLGRYAGIRLPRPEEAVDHRLDPLRVQTRLVSFAPAMAAMHWTDFAQMTAALKNVAAHLHAGRTVCVRVPVTENTATEDVTFAGCTVLPCVVTIEAGSGGLRMHVPRMHWFDGTEGPTDLLVSREEVLLARGDECGRLRFDAPITMQLLVEIFPNRDGGMQLGWGLSFGTDTKRGDAAIAVRLHPSTATYLLYEKQQCRRDGDDLLVTIADSELRIGPKGELRATTPTAPPGFDLQLNDRTFDAVADELHRRLDGAHVQPLWGYFGAQLAEASSAALTGEATRQRDALLLMHSSAVFMRKQLDGFFNAPSRDASVCFVLPSTDEGDLPMAEIANWLLTTGRVTFAERTWPITLIRAVPDLMWGTAATRAAAGRAIAAIADVADAGPLELCCTSHLLAESGFATISKAHAAKALERCTFAAAFADLLVLAPEGHQARSLLQRLGAHWRGDPALTPLFATLPAGADDLAACEFGCHRLWDEWLSALLRDDLKAHR